MLLIQEYNPLEGKERDKWGEGPKPSSVKI